MKILLFCALPLLGSYAALHAQDASGFPVGGKFLKGYERSLSGQVLSYWSFHPFAKQSLLSRATTGDMAIEWETEPVPPAPREGELHFLWIGAFSTGTSGADHDFDFYINGTKRLTFRTRMGGHYDDWSVRGTGGIGLSYKHVWKDHVNDAHGYFCLTVPAAQFAAGRPLALKVVGHKSDTRDWYMTFAHAVRESALVRPLPVQVRGPGVSMQPLEVDIDYPADSGTAQISIAGGAPTRHRLHLGWNPIELLVKAVRTETQLPVQISVNGKESQRYSVIVRPVTPRTLVLLPHSHNDIGYSDIQTKVLDIQIENIRDALRLIGKTRDYPADSRFKWNIEILWPIDSLLQKATPAEWERFLQAVRDGSIGLNAMYVNPLTGIARPEVLMHLMDFAREFRDSTGISIRAAMISDIPGTSWGIVPALAQSGVRYFSSGPNAGDRVGHYTNAWGDKPFYWLSPDGKDSVLMWVAGTGYSLFHATRTFRENQAFRQKLHEYLDHLDTVRYPYELVQMRYSIYSDNGMTDSTMSDFVRDWNERYESPTIRIATTEELFTEFEERYGQTLPSYAGDLTPYWEDGAASSAFETGLVQRACERLVQAGILATMTRSESVKERALADAWDAVNLWVEHTWGAWNSVSEADEAGAVAQWNIKKGFALASESRTAEFMRRALASEKTPPGGTLEVINTASWSRSDVVFVSEGESTGGDRIEDEQGKPVPSQRLSSGELAFLAQDVPPFSSRRYQMRPGKAEPRGTAHAQGLTLSNGILEISLDRTTGGIRSLRSSADGYEYADQTSAGGLNEFIYVAGTSPTGARIDSVTAIRTGESGRLVASLVVESRSPGCNAVRREIRLMHGTDRVDIINTIDKKPVREKESVHFRFPFAIEKAVNRMDLGWAFIRPEQDQLPGSCKDYFSVQRWVDVSGTDRGVTWSAVESPLVELGQIADETHHNDGPGGWKTTAESSPVVISFVMNNYWHTNYKADQEGRSSYHYAIRPHRGFDAVHAYRFGIERNQMLLVRSVSPSQAKPSLPFSIESDGVTVTSIKPSRDGLGFIVRLYNPAPEEKTVKILWRDRKMHRHWRSSFMEDRGQELGALLTFGQFEVSTVWLER